MGHKISNCKVLRYIYILHINNHKKSKHFGHSEIYYTGQTNNLNRRKKLVYVEYIYSSEWDAISREKQIKTYNRGKKEELIKSDLNMLINYFPFKAIILKKYNRPKEQIAIKLG